MQIVIAKTTTIRTLYVHVILNGVILRQILYNIVPYGKIDPSHLLSEHVDLPFLLCFSKQCLVENIQGKFQKICNFNFWGIALTKYFLG